MTSDEKIPGVVGFEFQVDEFKKARLMAKLMSDSLSKSKFFDLMIDLYLSNDQYILDVIEVWHKANVRHNKKQRAKYIESKKEGLIAVKDFSLEEDDKLDLYNIISDE